MNTVSTSLPFEDTQSLALDVQPWPEKFDFWYAQTVGWFGYFVVHYLNAVIDSPLATWWASLLGAATGFILTSSMRPILVRFWKKGPVTLILVALGTAFLAAVPYSAVSEQLYWVSHGKGWHLASPIDYLGSAFWCGSILLTWAGIYYGFVFYQQANEQKIKAAQALATAREARLSVLKERLNPHFLFNTLNSISTLVLDQQNKQAACMLDKLCDLLRKSIDERPSQFITLTEELELAELYLQIQHTRFADRLRVHWKIEPQARAFLLPSMILQPLLENAIQYAVQPDPEGADITVSATLTDTGLNLQVQDTGKALGCKKGSGVGHSNLQERLQTLYTQAIHFNAEALATGYQVDIHLPVVNPDD